VDEQQALEVLEDASDYERGFERLDEAQKDAVRNLREAAGDPGKASRKVCMVLVMPAAGD
jgi:hypothetical protein